jgi:hypothetical protein
LVRRPPQGHPWLEHVRRDYDAHAKRCSVFLGDLLSLIREASDTPRRQVIEAWLTGAAPTSAETESATVLGDITEWALDPARNEQAVYSVRLPEAPAVRKQAERSVTPRAESPHSHTFPSVLRFICTDARLVEVKREISGPSGRKPEYSFSGSNQLREPAKVDEEWVRDHAIGFIEAVLRAN